MNKNSITPADLCLIIETCGKVGVRHFVHGDLEIHFDEPTVRETITQAPIDYSQFEEKKIEGPKDQGQDVTPEELDRLAAENPQEYERILFERELNGNDE